MDEHELEKLVLRYSDGLRERHYPTIHERERDRKALSPNATELDSARKWGMDSRMYLLLARTHDEAGRQLLLRETSPRQRIGMLAALTRRCFYPLVGVVSATLIELPPLLRLGSGGGEAVVSFDETDQIDHAVHRDDVRDRPSVPIRRRKISQEDLLRDERRVSAMAKKGITAADLAEMSMEEIQILSHHLGSGAEARFALCGDRIEPWSGSHDHRHRATVVLANRAWQGVADT